MRRRGLDPAGSGQEQMASLCEHGNKFWGTVQFDNLISNSGPISCSRTVLPGVVVSQSPCLSASQSVILSVCLSVCLPFSLSVSQSDSQSLSVCLSVSQLRFFTRNRISSSYMMFENRKQPNQQPVDTQQ